MNILVLPLINSIVSIIFWSQLIFFNFLLTIGIRQFIIQLAIIVIILIALFIYVPADGGGAYGAALGDLFPWIETDVQGCAGLAGLDVEGDRADFRDDGVGRGGEGFKVDH